MLTENDDSGTCTLFKCRSNNGEKFSYTRRVCESSEAASGTFLHYSLNSEEFREEASPKIDFLSQSIRVSLFPQENAILMQVELVNPIPFSIFFNLIHASCSSRAFPISKQISMGASWLTLLSLNQRNIAFENMKHDLSTHATMNGVGCLYGVYLRLKLSIQAMSSEPRKWVCINNEDTCGNSQNR